MTEGLLRTLSRDELQAVVAHEMAHMRNLDIRLMTLLAGMVGAVALMSDGMGRAAGRAAAWRRAGGSGGAARRQRRQSAGAGHAGALAADADHRAVRLPVLAMAVSRKREYLADATGAQFTRNPMALASALEKLEARPAPTRAITRGAAHLCIVDPAPVKLASKEGFLADSDVSSADSKRIIRLQGMAYQQAKRETAGAVSPS